MTFICNKGEKNKLNHSKAFELQRVEGRMEGREQSERERGKERKQMFTVTSERYGSIMQLEDPAGRQKIKIQKNRQKSNTSNVLPP